jgi:peptide/nickel transport system permease protein
MLRYARSRAVLWFASLCGALLFAAAIAALAVPGISPGTALHFGSLLRELPFMLAFAPGDSIIANAPALAAAAAPLLVTLRLLLGSLPIALLVGCTLALLLAVPRTRSLFRWLVRVAGAVPLFCAALLLAILLDLFAAPGATALGPDLPLILTIGIAGAGPVARALTRVPAAVRGDGHSLARFGLRDGQIARRRVLRQGLGCALNEAGNIALALFSASAVVEWVFGRPGAGAAFIQSVALGDWNVVAVLIMVIAGVRFTLDLLGALAGFALLGEAPP